MFRKTVTALMLSAAVLVAGLTDQAAAQYVSHYPTQVSYDNRANMGGGFIEFLFGDQQQQQQQMSPYQQRYQNPQYAPQAEPYQQPTYQRQPMYQEEREQAYEPATPARPGMDPKFLKQTVSYSGRETPGTIVIDTPSKFLYLVQGDGQALRYGIGVGKPGFTWSGVKSITMKKEWPSWVPPAEMLKRRPDLPRFMNGGPDNPLGARAMYLGSTLYRIHGSNEPWTIGTSVSSGCIRMRNEDVIDLYERVKVGTRVVVI
jgi:lipoprotein-anchoring transpeptidase ErfK/SrfK